MKTMTDRERFNATMHFLPVDRVPFVEMRPWPATYWRWLKEGMIVPEGEEPTADPEPGASLGDIFGMGLWKHLREQFDLCLFETMCVNADVVPGFEEKIISEENNQRVRVDRRGRTLKELIDDPMLSMPEMIDFPVKTRADFREYTKRYDPDDPKRFPDNWDDLVAGWVKRDNPLRLGDYPSPWGLFGSIREIAGFEPLLYMFYDDPVLLEEMMEFFTEYCLAFCRKVLPQVEVDYIWLWEDMAYKTASMISPEHFRRFMLPRYRRITDYIRSQGVDLIIVDSDGKLDDLIPLWLEAGINGVEPLEVQCGSDPVALRKKYGKDLVMAGGIDKRALAKGKKEIDEELKQIPWLLEQGGFIPMLDHDVPPDVSWKNFVYYRESLNRICAGR